MRSGFIFALALAAALPASAVDWKSLEPQGYVSDFAGVIDPRDRAEIEAYAARVEQATKAQLAFVTVPSLDGEPIEDVANDLFRAWGIGRKGEDDGAMVLLSIRDHKSRLEVGGGLGGAVPDGMAGLLLDDMRPALRQNQYGAAMLQAAIRLGSTIAQAKNVKIAAPTGRPVETEPQDEIPWPLILFGIFILLVILRRGGGGGFWTGMLLGSLFNSGGGRGGGGGFGGYDSGGGGGGFGGFGGGDSGGGGASSDW